MLLGKTGDKRLIAELFPFSHPMYQHQMLEAVEDLSFCQHGEEGADGGAG